MRPALLALLFPALAGAHAALEVRIAALNQQIAAAPARAELYLERGELRRVHRDWDAALADFNHALELEPSLAAAVLARGRALHESGRSSEALADLDRYRELRPEHREGMLVRARALAGAGRPRLAALEHEAAVRASKNPTPEYFLERARAWAAAGDLDAALAGLDEGVEALGPLVTLQRFGIALELGARRFDAALSRLETIRKWTPEERYRLHRAEILEAAGSTDAAQAELRLALQAAEARAATGRRTAGLDELAAYLRGRLAER